MAYFAKLENGIVTEIVAVSNQNAPDPAPENSESLGQAFLASIGLGGEWKQTSFNGSFRFNYAGLGYTFDETKGTDGAFIPPKPFDSWILNEETCLWEAPIPYPNDGLVYSWDEESGDWIEVVEPSA